MVQFVSYLRCVLSKMCLIFSRVNGPIMEVITPKKHVFCFSHFDIFGGNMSSQNSCQILFLKEVTTRTSKVKTFLKYAYLPYLPVYNAHFFPLKSTFKFTMHTIHGFHCLAKKTKEDKSFVVIGV